jgi:hypothetical protein
MPDERIDRYLAKAKHAAHEAARAATAELSRQWLLVAETYRKIAATLRGIEQGSIE